MRTILRVTSIVLFCFITYPSVLVSADFLGDIMKKELPQLPGARELPIGQAAGKGLDDSTIASGLKEALAIGTKNAVNLVSTKLYDEFKPSISESMNQVGVARSYNAMMSKVPANPFFVKPESVDLDHYVTSKALDGLFQMVGQEEQKIRTNPVARTTDLLTKVFGK